MIDEETQTGAFSEHLVSFEPQPHIAAGYNNVQQTMIAALRTLPKKEAKAVLNKLGLGNSSKQGKASASVSDEEKALYRKGLRKLRKLMLDPTFSDLNTAIEAQIL